MPGSWAAPSVVLGGGRDKVDDTVDPGVGIMIRATVGDAVRAGDAILELHYRDAARLDAALPLATARFRVGAAAAARGGTLIIRGGRYERIGSLAPLR